MFFIHPSNNIKNHVISLFFRTEYNNYTKRHSKDNLSNQYFIIEIRSKDLVPHEV